MYSKIFNLDLRIGSNIVVGQEGFYELIQFFKCIVLTA